MRHELSPIHEARVGNEERRHCIVGYTVRYWLAKEIVGCDHANNAPKLKLGYVGNAGNFVIRDLFKRDVGQDVKMAKPVQACKLLILQPMLAIVSNDGRLCRHALHGLAVRKGGF